MGDRRRIVEVHSETGLRFEAIVAAAPTAEERFKDAASDLSDVYYLPVERVLAALCGGDIDPDIIYIPLFVRFYRRTMKGMEYVATAEMKAKRLTFEAAYICYTDLFGLMQSFLQQTTRGYVSLADELALLRQEQQSTQIGGGDRMSTTYHCHAVERRCLEIGAFMRSREPPKHDAVRSEAYEKLTADFILWLHNPELPALAQTMMRSRVPSIGEVSSLPLAVLAIEGFIVYYPSKYQRQIEPFRGKKGQQNILERIHKVLEERADAAAKSLLDLEETVEQQRRKKNKRNQKRRQSRRKKTTDSSAPSPSPSLPPSPAPSSLSSPSLPLLPPASLPPPLCDEPDGASDAESCYSVELILDASCKQDLSWQPRRRQTLRPNAQPFII